MKKVLLVACLCATSFFFAQAPFDRFDGTEGVQVMQLNKKMIDLVSKVKLDVSDKDNLRYIDFLKKLDYLKVITTKNSLVRAELNKIAHQYVQTAGLVSLLETAEERGFIFIKPTMPGKAKEVLLFAQDSKSENFVFASFSGDITLSELSALTNKIAIPFLGAIK